MQGIRLQILREKYIFAAKHPGINSSIFVQTVNYTTSQPSSFRSFSILQSHEFVSMKRQIWNK